MQKSKSFEIPQVRQLVRNSYYIHTMQAMWGLWAKNTILETQAHIHSWLGFIKFERRYGQICFFLFYPVGGRGLGLRSKPKPLTDWVFFCCKQTETIPMLPLLYNRKQIYIQNSKTILTSPLLIWFVQIIVGS